MPCRICGDTLRVGDAECHEPACQIARDIGKLRSEFRKLALMHAHEIDRREERIAFLERRLDTVIHQRREAEDDAFAFKIQVDHLRSVNAELQLIIECAEPKEVA